MELVCCKEKWKERNDLFNDALETLYIYIYIIVIYYSHIYNIKSCTIKKAILKKCVQIFV